MTAHSFKDINHALPALMNFVLEGRRGQSRNGKVRERTMVQTTLKRPGNGYLTSPTRAASLPAQIAETMWLLAGRNDVEWLSHYLPRAAEFSDDGKVWRGGYGPRIRRWEVEDDRRSLDQLAHVVDLLVKDPTSRRAVINIYDPAIDSAPGKDIPCNNWVHFLPQEGGVLEAHVAIRSNDLMWGFSGINHFEWTQLLNIVAALTDMTPGAITFSASSLHLYEPYWAKAKRIASEPIDTAVQPFYSRAPQFTPKMRNVKYLDAQVKMFFQLEELIRTGQATHLTSAKMDEPLFRSWLQVLYAWHNPVSSLPPYLRGTDLEAALAASPKRKAPEPEPVTFINGSFAASVAELHEDKHKAYGDSWMRRGEQIGIMANIARKVDRLGVAGGGDTAADTAIDLLAYLIKYDLWLQNERAGSGPSLTGGEHVEAFNRRLMQEAVMHRVRHSKEYYTTVCKSRFDTLEQAVTQGTSVAERRQLVATMISAAYPLAKRLHREQSNATRSWNPGA